MSFNEKQSIIYPDTYHQAMLEGYKLMHNAIAKYQWEDRVRELQTNTRAVSALTLQAIQPYRTSDHLTIVYPFSNTDLLTTLSFSPHTLEPV